MWDHRARWRFLGTELGIDEGTLDAISMDGRDVGDCLRMTLNLWLRNTEPRPTRSALREALNSERVSGKANDEALSVITLTCYSMHN